MGTRPRVRVFTFTWRASGNPDSTFEANWPELQRRYLMQQMQVQENRWESIF